MFEINLLIPMMIFLIFFLSIIGVLPCLSIALIGILFGLSNIGLEIFLPIPSKIYSDLYNSQWFCIPLLIFLSNLNKNFLDSSEILQYLKILKKNNNVLARFLTLLPVNLKLTGLIYDKYKHDGSDDLSFVNSVFSKQNDPNFVFVSNQFFVTLLPPSLILILVLNTTGIIISDFFEHILIPFACYLFFLMIFFFYKIKWDNYSSEEFTEIADLEKKLITLKIFTPYFLVFLIICSVTFDFLTLLQCLCIAIVFTIFLIIVQNKNLKKILLSCFKKTSEICAVILISLVCAQFFIISFETLGGHDFIMTKLSHLELSVYKITLLILLIVFLFQLIFTWLEVCFVLLPLLLPIIIQLEMNPIWLSVLVCFCFYPKPLGTKRVKKSDFTVSILNKIIPDENFFKFIPLLIIQIIFIIILFNYYKFFINISV